MRAIALFSLVVLALAGCDRDAPAPAPELAPEPAPAAATPTPEPLAPWAVRTVRTCSTWSGSTLQATDRHLFACDGATFDARTARLVRGGFQVQRRLATQGDRSAWAVLDANAVAIFDGSLHERRISVPDAWFGGGAFSADGSRLLLVDEHGLSMLALRTGTLSRPDGAERCTDAVGLGFDGEGRPQCVVPRDEGDALVTLGAGEVALEGAQSAHWAGDFVVVHTGEAIRWLRTDGTLVAQRDAAHRQGVLDVRDDGAVIVSGDAFGRGTVNERVGATERWWLEGDVVHHETLYDRPSERGVFVGDEIALAVFEHVVWLHRGPAADLDRSPPATPEGYERLPAHEHTFGDDNFERGPEDVARFSSRNSSLLLSRTHADELAGFEGLDAWARAAMSRYVEVGTERWAKAWAEPDGSRVLRGHSYIGGCERTHIDVLVRERGETLERWVAMSGEPTQDGPFASMPDDARDVSDTIVEGYAGDPSTGPI